MKKISKFEKKAKKVFKEFKNFIPKKLTRGRPRESSRKIFYGILYVLIAGCPWRMVPEKYGNYSTIHGTFTKWTKNKVFKKFYDEMVKEYKESGKIIYPLAIDGSHSKSPKSKFGGKSPVDRSKKGIKIVVIVDQNKVPLSIKSGPGNNHDSYFYKDSFDELDIDLKDKNFNKIILGDSAFDSENLKKYSESKGFKLITNYNKRRNKKDKNIENLIIKKRTVVEHFFAWFQNFRSIKTCWCILQESFDSFLQLASSLKILSFF